MPRKKASVPSRLLRTHRRLRAALLVAAALPLYQVTCYPDLFGALNFELQRLINSTLINAVDIIVRNVLRL